MKIEKMTIDNICGIKHLDLVFNNGLNLICGENGVGKTTIIKAIAHYFIYGEDSFIKKHYGTNEGSVKMKFFDFNECLHYEITEFIPGYIKRYVSFHKNLIAHKLLYFSTERAIKYIRMDSLPVIKNIEADSTSNHSSSMLISGVNNNIKSWFISRFLFSNINSLSDEQISNFKLAKKIFKLLDNELSVKTVQSNLEIVLNKGSNEIYFEMLSDGYKSCIYILLGIIKEIEYRFPLAYAQDFDGIVMIDEIDIHLHPQWQAKLINLMKRAFPNAQIIATTHSPSILQTATAEEIIPLYKDKDDNIHVKKLNLGKYGLQGWTLEEILQDVMGMPATTSELYIETMKNFDAAMNEENQDKIIEYYKKLKKMLHPQNPMLQLIEIQVAEWKN